MLFDFIYESDSMIDTSSYLRMHNTHTQSYWAYLSL